MSLSRDRTSMNSRPLNAETWDRWADGELTDAEQHDLLVRLDLEPEHWRPLALAFVEAQALRRACRGQMELLPDAQPVHQPPAAARRARSARSAHSRLLPAAIFLCLAAFAGGWWGRGQIVRPAPATAFAAAGPATFAGQDTEPAAAGAADVPQRVETLRIGFANPEGEITENVDVPVIDQSEGDVSAWLSQPLVSDSVRERLRRAGNTLREETELYQVTLDDGRQALIPIRNVTFEPLGPGDFQ